MLEFCAAIVFPLSVVPSVQGGGGCSTVSLAPSSPVADGNRDLSITVGDLNLDGKPDMAVADPEQNSVKILLGDGTGGFLEAPAVDGGPRPRMVAIGDLDRDGNPDLAIASEGNPGGGYVTIQLGDGMGGFSSGSPVTAGPSPHFVALGDLNLDGKLDLAVVDFGCFQCSSNVKIHLGDGAGGFSIGSPLDAEDHEDYPDCLAIEDLNLDGKPDLAIANTNVNDVTIRLGDGMGGFPDADATRVNVGLDPWTGPTFLAVGDLDLDGKPDLATANIGINDVAIRLGDGLGGFPRGSNFSLRASPRALASGDFNLDGKPDLAVACPGNLVSESILEIWLGDGQGGFPDARRSILESGLVVSPDSLGMGDFDLDGKPDLAVAGLDHIGTGSYVTVHRNACAAYPCAATRFSQPAGSPLGVAASPSSVAIGDFDLDGKPDMAVPDADFASVSILLGNGAGGFTADSFVGAGSNPEGVASGDFDLDGKPDLAIANRGSANVTIRLGDGQGGFPDDRSSAVSADIGATSVAVGDLNLDGKLDLAVANAGSSDFDGNVTIHLGDGTGAFPARSVLGWEELGFAWSQPSSVAIDDLDLDGKPDIAVANFESGDVTVRLGDGLGGFPEAETSVWGVDGPPTCLATGDLNLDGKPDLAVACPTDSMVHGHLTLLLGDGLGGFSSSSTWRGESSPTHVAIEDLDLDGKPDLAVTSSDEFVSIRLGDGAGGFVAGTSSVFAGQFPRSVATGDLNLDDRPDLAVATRGSFGDGSVIVQLSTCGANRLPEVFAGDDRMVECAGGTTPVTLDGSGSDDDGDELLYSWEEHGHPIEEGVNPTVALHPGSHTLTLIVRDPHGGMASDDVTIEVVDTTAPTITLLGSDTLTVECHTSFTDPGADASDACGIAELSSSGSVDVNALGSYTITYTATDGTSSAEATRTVNVVDSSAPAITPTTNVIRLDKANHKYVEFAVGAFALGATDGCDAAIDVSDVVIASVSSDEPENVAGTGDGNTLQDIVIAANCRSVRLRAERADGRNGRVYTVTLQVKDTAGNVGVATRQVFVPVVAGGTATNEGAAAGYTVSGSCH